MKSSPYFWLQYIQSKVRWRFRKILWPSQIIWTLNLCFSVIFNFRYPYYPWSSVLKQSYFVYRLTHVMLRGLRQMSIFAHVLCKNECRTQSSQDPLDHKCTSTHVIPLDGFTFHTCTYYLLLSHMVHYYDINVAW